MTTRTIRAAVAAVLVVTGLTWGSLMPTAQAASQAYYVDCSVGANGNGTQASPWNTLSAVNSKSGGFGAGDSILLKRGTACQGGYLAPSGSGASGSPILVSAYGSGAKPVIRPPANWDYGVYLHDQSYWTVAELEVVGGTRYGVYVTVTSGVSRGITLRNLLVHDVRGGNMNDKSTGLVVVAPNANDQWNSSGARFDGVLIDGVVAHDTNMWAGIIVGGGPNSDNWATDESKRSTNVTVRNSTVYNTYGDGIILFVVNNGLIEHSVAHDTGIQPAPVTIGTPNAIWTWACNGCTVQWNEAYHNYSPGVDGGAFDIDYYSQNTVVQYNYGHDNSTYCAAIFGAEGYVNTNNIVRYNICANNGTGDASTAAGSPEIVVFTWDGGYVNGAQIYNNTLVTNHAALSSYQASYTGALSNFFKNNLVYSRNSNPVGSNGGLTSDYNLWFYTGGSFYNGEPHSVYADPLLLNPGHSGAGWPNADYQLNSSSPAIGRGVSIPGFSGSDFYGTPVPQGNAVDIGVHEASNAGGGGGSGPLVTNGGFESGTLNGWSNWPSGGSIVTAPVHSGAYAARQTGSGAGIYRTITGLTPSTTYTLRGWIRADAGQFAYLYVKNNGSAAAQSATASAATYTQYTVTFSTGPGSTSAEIGLWRDSGFGNGSVYFDDISLQ